MKKTAAVYLLLFSFHLLFSQKEADHWFFGQYAGVHFTTGTAITGFGMGSALYSGEGCASISDAKGNLLFFTDGEIVYDKNKNVMPSGTGLKGYRSSTQSCVIVPYTCNKYYIFQADGLTWPVYGSVTGPINDTIFSYSIVDMSLNGGLGDVSVKNVNLLPGVNERVAAVKHANGKDTWVMVHRFKSNKFYAFLVGENGIAAPVISTVGPIEKSNGGYHIKFSPNGKRIAMTDFDLFKLFVYDFDNATGVVSNPMDLGLNSSAYGYSFSPNSDLLYVSQGQYYLMQYNLKAGSQAAIIASKDTIHQPPPMSGNDFYGWAIQNAPDGKMYIAISSGFNDNYLGVINNPNVIGKGCNYAHKGFSIAPMVCINGLPNFIESYFDPSYKSPVNGNDSIAITAAGPLSICQGDSVLLNAGLGYKSYLWSNGDTTSSIYVSTAGNYSVKAINLCDTSVSNVITLNVNALPSVSVTATATCSTTGTATALVSGGSSPYTYSWSLGGSGTVAAISGLNSGNYFLEVIDANGCKDTSNFTVTNSSGLVVNPQITTPIVCATQNTGAVNAVVSGGTSGFSYSWSGAASNQTTQQVTGLSAGTYTVKVTDANNCEAIQQVVLTEPSKLNITSTYNDAICKTNGKIEATVSGGVSAYTYSWSNTSKDTIAVFVPAGNYTLIVSDANGCSVSKTFTIKNTGSLNTALNYKFNVNCKGGSDGFIYIMEPWGGLPNYTYTWSSSSGTLSQTTQTVSGLVADTYTVHVEDSQGCTTSLSVTITEPASNVSATVTKTDASCGNLNGTATAVPSGGGTAYYLYTWNTTPTQTTKTASGLQPGTYTVVVTDANSCTTTATVQITSLPGLNITVPVQQNVSCFGLNNGALTVSPAGGDTPYTYSWQSSTTASFNTQAITGLSPGTYTVNITDNAGCSATQSFSITEPTGLQVNITATDASCSGQNDGKANVTVLGGDSPYVYSWASASSTTDSITGLGAGVYTALVTDKNGCTKTSTTTVGQGIGPGLTISSDTTILEGGTAQLLAQGTGNFVWSPASDLSCTTCANPVASPTITTTYSVIITDSKGCTAIKSVTVFVDYTCADLFIPTAFSPNGDGVNDVFKARGYCISDFKLSVFTRWGEKVFETMDITQGWDGYYNNKLMNAGTFVYHVQGVKKQTGESIGLKGNVTLVR